MISTQLIELALRAIHPAPTEEAQVGLRTALAVEISRALRQLAEVAAPTNLLRRTFTVTAAAGEAALTTPLAASEPLLLNHLRRASIYITGYSTAAQWKADRSSLSFAATTQFPYYTLEGQTLVIRDGDGLDHYAGSVIIRNAPYIPLLGGVPTSLEPVLVELLVACVMPQVERKERRAS